MARRILLVEPAYSNKYPPLGLMKISAYHKMLGDEVTFVKGTSAALRDEIWDRIYVTTLFSFYWDITIKTIKYYKRSVCKTKDFFIGGILASTLGDDIESEVGIKPFKGLLNSPGILDKGNEIIIDQITPDYDILDQIDYAYPSGNSYIAYMTRGCVNRCPFCAVPVIEPKFNDYISITNQINNIDELFGKKSNLLLMDNNVLGSKKFNRIIDELKDLGFGRGASYIPDNLFEIYCNRLRSNPDDNVARNKIYNILQDFRERLKRYVDVSNRYHEVMNQFFLQEESHPDFVANVLAAYDDLSPIIEKYRNKAKKQRFVDFNQGIDARLVNAENMKKLSEINIKPLRIAYDHISLTDIYTNAVSLAAKNDIYDLSNYILFNYNDKPEDFYYRLENNIKLNLLYNTRIYSFPMKYIPVTDKNRRDYIGKHWSRKYIRAIQSVINVTKGSVAPGDSFFYKAFGRDIDEFHKIMMMPEPLIIQRFASENSGLTSKWWNDYLSLESDVRSAIREKLLNNDFIIKEKELTIFGTCGIDFFKYYNK